MVLMLTWSDWVVSPGFGGTAAVVAATIAFAGVGRSIGTQRRLARRSQWWDGMKWAVELALSPDEASVQAGLSVMDALAQAERLDPDERAFVSQVFDLFMDAERSGRLEEGERSGLDEREG